MPSQTKPEVSIYYCPRCRWLPRATWLAQELLTTFSDHLAGINLRPAESGRFDVYLNDVCLFSRAFAGRFPEPKELKQLIRDQVVPNLDLGHSDRETSTL